MNKSKWKSGLWASRTTLLGCREQPCGVGGAGAKSKGGMENDIERLETGSRRTRI